MMLKKGDKIKLDIDKIRDNGYDGLDISVIVSILNNLDAVYTVNELSKFKKSYPITLVEIGGNFALDEVIKVD